MDVLHFSVRSAVNQHRHLRCQIPSATTHIFDSAGEQSPRPVSRMSRSSLPPHRYFKEYSDLTVGEKLYLWSIEKIYNVQNLKRLKQEQYQKLLELEAKKGSYPVFVSECSPKDGLQGILRRIFFIFNKVIL